MTTPRTYELVVMGASWGGLDALRSIAAALPEGFGAPVVVAQHRAPESHPTAFSELLRAVGHLDVREADDKDEIRAGTIYVAPPDYHLLVEGERFVLSTDEPVSYARPSIDVLLASAAEAFRERCVGVVLTGANADGADGLKRVAELGGAAIVQAPETAVRPEMPRAALKAVPAAEVLEVEAIGPRLVQLCGTARIPA
jgi:two-component system, chemotaxis family, protein-glutamate methylesterase/glutaminase